MIERKEEVKIMCYSKEEIQAYLDSEVAQQERWRMEVHIADCQECQNFLAELKKHDKTVLSGLKNYTSTIQNLNPDSKQAWLQFTEKHGRERKRYLLKGVGQYMNRNAKIAGALAVVARS